MKKTLLLFTSAFPYNTSEPFLNPEFPLYEMFYQHVVIVTSRKKNEKPTRKLDLDFFTVIDDCSHSGDYLALLHSTILGILDKQFYREIVRLIKAKKFSLKKICDLFIATSTGNYRAWLAHKWFQKNNGYKVQTIYSYWFNVAAYSAVKTKEKYFPKCFLVSRAHGYDLYEDRYKTKYPPNQLYIYNKVDYIAPISKNGKKYLNEKYGESSKVNVWYLGAKDNKVMGPIASRNSFRIVSCARVVKVKRLHKIIDALKKIENLNIIWTHLGDGDLLDDLKMYSMGLPDNIKIDFRGNLSNEDIYKIYEKEPFHIFLNTSASEGIPVSIMEAMSFGIPTIATNVGGTSELVDNGKNGLLLDVDYDDNELVKALELYSSMSESDYFKQRVAAREKFLNSFNAEKNCTDFLSMISDKSN